MNRLNDLETYTEKSVHFDIPCAWYWGHETTGQALDAMQLELDSHEDYKYLRDEPLPPFDRKGQYVTVRRHYIVIDKDII